MYCQDNVFVNIVASVQYRAVPENAKDAFYMLTDPKGQIQSYVYDGNRVFVVCHKFVVSSFAWMKILGCGINLQW
jgi:hypothetical protein